MGGNGRRLSSWLGGDMRIITEPKETIGRYVASKLESGGKWTDFVAFGLVNNDQELMAGVVFNGYTPPAICRHIAAEKMTPTFIAVIMDYAFRQLKCKRVTGVIDRKNRASRRFALHLGAKLEGVMRDATPNGDTCIYGLLRKDAERWLTPKYKQRMEQ